MKHLDDRNGLTVQKLETSLYLLLQMYLDIRSITDLGCEL